MNLYATKNSDYLKDNPSWHIEDSPWKAKQILKMITKNQLPLKTIAEIGCGAGEILRQMMVSLQDKEIQFLGYDIAPDLIPFWKERESDCLKFYQENMIDNQYDFDLLLMIDVFEHVEDYFGFIKNTKDKAKYKIYHIPLEISALGSLTDVPISNRKSVGHLHFFTQKTALSTLQDCGVTVIDYFYTNGNIELGNKRLRAKIANIPRRIIQQFDKDFAVKLLGGYSLLVLGK